MRMSSESYATEKREQGAKLNAKGAKLCRGMYSGLGFAIDLIRDSETMKFNNNFKIYPNIFHCIAYIAFFQLNKTHAKYLIIWIRTQFLVN